MTARVENQFQSPSWRRALTQFARRNGLQLGIVGVMLALWLLFIIGAPRTFLSRDIYRALMASVPYWGIIALPLTMLIIAGEIDLSFGSIMAVGMVTFVQVFKHTDSLGLSADARLGLAAVACLAAGFLVGLSNGIIVTKIGIPSLVATIGTQYFWRGVVIVVTNGRGETLTMTKGTILRNSLVNRVFGYVPGQMIWMVVVAILVWIILNRHKLGAHTYLVGDNENSARLMGVNVDRTKMMLFALVGLAAAFGGLIQSEDVWFFWPNLGDGYLLPTLAAVFLGGTSVFGGTGTVLGTFIAAFIIGAIQPGIIAIGKVGPITFSGFWTNLIYGLIITASVSLQTIVRKRVE
jgi:simple sugar transport system permease protein